VKRALALAMLTACGPSELLWLGADRASNEPGGLSDDAGTDAGLDEYLPPGAPSDGIYLYWQLDQDDLTQAFDASGNEHIGTLANGPSLSEPAPVLRGGNRRGRFFNGTGETLFYDGDVPGDAFSISLWVKPAAPRSATLLVRRDAASQLMFELSIGPEGQFEVHAEAAPVAGTCASETTCLIGTRTIVVDQWYHLVLSAEADGALRLFVDGALEGDVPSTFASDGSHLELGTMVGASLAGLRGVIDEVLVYDHVISPGDVIALGQRIEP
jgi:hypothetical protein